jgi:hypothetical protein
VLDDAACLPVFSDVLPVSPFRCLPDAHIVDPFHMAPIAKDGTELTNNAQGGFMNSDYRRYGRRPLVI